MKNSTKFLSYFIKYHCQKAMTMSQINNIVKNISLISFSSAQNLNKKPIYLDMQATTPIDFRVADAMLPLLTSKFGNPHSNSHYLGWEAALVISKYRQILAKAINADSKDLIFTSGATESNNTVLKGLVQFYGKKRNHIITTQIDHKSVLDTCKQLEKEGINVTYLPVQNNGLIDLKLLEKSIRKETLLVSVIHVNNEIGVIQPISEIGHLCRSKKVFFHTDISQSLGKIPIDVEAMQIDLISMTAHKMYGPKGIGGLYVRRKPKVRLFPLISGGGQERGIRNGTLPPSLIAGFGEACRVSVKEMKNDYDHIKKLADFIINQLKANIKNIQFNGDMIQRYPGNINISIKNANINKILKYLEQQGIALSAGSACLTGLAEPSYILKAVLKENALPAIRIGLGRFTTKEEVEYFTNNIIKAANDQSIFQ